jgi:hypothetical protein
MSNAYKPPGHPSVSVYIVAQNARGLIDNLWPAKMTLKFLEEMPEEFLQFMTDCT